MTDDRPDYVARNVAEWSAMAPRYAVLGERLWQQSEPTWGIWQVPEAELGLLPDVAGKDTLEVGCGTAYISAWLTRLGARAVGLDPTPAQLDTARRLQEQFDVSFRLIDGVGESLPFDDASFDLVISEYGASIWSDPYLWIPEAARVLRPGGDLVFLVNGTLLILCADDYLGVPAHTALRRPYFGLHRLEWPDDDSVEFHLPYGEMIRLLRANDLEVVDLVELQAPADAKDDSDGYVTAEWARQWPSEEVWKARKRD
jgi:SAM-dependent methyltransferase